MSEPSKDELDQIIDYINQKYDNDIPGPVKFVVRRKLKKIEKLKIEDYPESIRKCTLEQLILILKDAYSQGKLKF